MSFSSIKSAYALPLLSTPTYLTASTVESFSDGVAAGIGGGVGAMIVCAGSVVIVPPLAPVVCGGSAVVEGVLVWLGIAAAFAK